MTKIFIISDLHTAEKIQSVTVPDDVDVIVIAGDIEHVEIVFKYFAQFDKPVIAVAGNHDFWRKDISEGVAALKALAAPYPNVHVLENETLTIGDLRFIGSTFWTSFGELHPRLVVEADAYLSDSFQIKAKAWLANKQNIAFIEEKITQIEIEAQRIPAIKHFLPSIEKILDLKHFHPIISYAFHKEAVAFISAELAKPFQGKTIVVTHHPPTWESIRIACIGQKEVDPNFWNDRRFSPMGDSFDDLALHAEIAAGYGSPLETAFSRDFFQRFDGRTRPGQGHLRGAALWIHGHVHQNMEYALSGTRFVVNALEGHDFNDKQSVFDLNDGLDNTLNFAVRRVVYELDKIISGLHEWATCTEIESIRSEKIRRSLLMQLDELYSKATDALVMFRKSYCRATGDPLHGLYMPDLFQLPLNHPAFHFDYFSRDANQEMLSVDYIKKQIAALEQEKINLMEGKRYRQRLHGSK